MLTKLLRLRPRDWADVVSAQIALIVAQLLVWTRGTGALLAPAAGQRASAPDAGSHERVQRLALAVSRAADYGVIRPSCLVRSLALHRLLRGRGLPGSTLRVGVRRHDGALLAHAWVVYDGAVLGDDEWRNYQELTALDTLGDAG